jgi:CTP synthase (UTP-ammonia lyase)
VVFYRTLFALFLVVVVLSVFLQFKNSDLGGTMRLGAQKCRIQPDSKVFEMYQKDVIMNNKGEDFTIKGENKHIAARVLQDLTTLSTSRPMY